MNIDNFGSGRATQRVFRSGIIFMLLVLGLSGCAQTGATSHNDPLEPFNRKVNTFNDYLDRFFLKPVAQAYTFAIPSLLRTGISNAFDNISYPLVIVNQFLQGKPATGGQDLARLLVNSTAGIGGLFDVATGWGLPAHDEDFGQTFAVWGIPSGPYLVAPLFGPVTIRDGIGDIGGIFAYPPTYFDDVSLRNSLYGASLVDQRARLLKAEELVSGDRYLFIRDAYLQRREFLNNDGAVSETDPFLDD
ncbi:MAG: VacJ family lipoprotein [Pseudomonadales bacterium]|nr:VacJ family lipoprotein [Pseudomonadales bacterium]